MNQTSINISKNGDRVKLSLWQLFWHYTTVWFCLFITLMNLHYIVTIEITETYTGVRSTQDHLLVGLPWLIPAIVFGIIQYRRLKFKRFNSILSPEQFKTAAEQAGKEMNWNFRNLTKDYVIATTGFSGLSWGERITIIRKEKEILINSICNPDAILPSVASFGRNRKNVNAFVSKLNPK